MPISFSEERQIFYYELGLAITQWASVENSFQHLFTSSFKKYDHVVALSFNGIENFRSKLQVADIALRMNLKPELHDEWTSIQDRLRKRSATRNRLAHNYVRNLPNNKAGKRIILAAGGPSSEVGVREIVLYRYAFFGLSNWIIDFSYRVTGSKATFRIPHGPLNKPPSLEALVSQMRSENEPPNRPLRG